MQKPFALCLLSASLALASVAAPASATHPATPAQATVGSMLPSAAETFSIGTLRVQRYGDHGRAVILIPGLTCGPWEWAQTIEHLRHAHVVYALTLAGFDGLQPPAVKTGLMDQAGASLLELIESRHLDHPVLIGHSIGGTLAIRFATRHSNLLSGVVAVDGLPVFPGMDDLTPAQRSARAEAMRKRMGGMTSAQFKEGNTRTLEFEMLDQAKAAHYATFTARSDPASTLEYMAEDIAADTRQALKNVSVPLLEISPYDASDYAMIAARSGKPAMTEQAKTSYYRKLLANAPHAEVISIAPARHFVMLDQPHKFQQAIDTFLAPLQPRS
jgi:pimeloyl-ACP methyl ester carboxylesterase